MTQPTFTLDEIRAEAARAASSFRTVNAYEVNSPAVLHYISECAQTIAEAREALSDCPDDATEYAERQMRNIVRATEAREMAVHSVACGHYWRTPHATQAEKPSASDPFSTRECRAYLHAARAAQ